MRVVRCQDSTEFDQRHSNTRAIASAVDGHGLALSWTFNGPLVSAFNTETSGTQAEQEGVHWV